MMNNANVTGGCPVPGVPWSVMKPEPKARSQVQCVVDGWWMAAVTATGESG